MKKVFKIVGIVAGVLVGLSAVLFVGILIGERWAFEDVSNSPELANHLAKVAQEKEAWRQANGIKMQTSIMQLGR